MLYNRLRSLQLQANGGHRPDNGDPAQLSPLPSINGLVGDPLNPSQAHLLQVLQTENSSLRVRTGLPQHG